VHAIAVVVVIGGGGETLFVVKHDEDDALSAISKSAGVPEVRPIQMIGPELAWGGCTLCGRKACRRRDRRSVIRNIDGATPVETWVAPDLRFEEVVDVPDGTRLPRLTVFSRGHKFVFAVRASTVPGERGREHYGVYASCTILQGIGPDTEVNLKPGELIDLGVFSPLREEDRKALPSFIVKNYVHNLRPGRWAIVAGDNDDAVYDLSDDLSGDLHPVASERVLSYVHKRKKGTHATVHARLDPAGSVHLLFGVGTRGTGPNMRRGCSSSCRYSAGGRWRSLPTPVSMASGRRTTPGRSTCSRSESSKHIERCGQVVTCLEKRARNLRKMFADIRPQSEGIGLLDSALQNLSKLSRVLEER
jgi:hypothetical protein